MRLELGSGGRPSSKQASVFGGLAWPDTLAEEELMECYRPEVCFRKSADGFPIVRSDRGNRCMSAF